MRRHDQEHADRAGADPPAGEDPLLDPRRGRDQGRGRGLQEKHVPRRKRHARWQHPARSPNQRLQPRAALGLQAWQGPRPSRWRAPGCLGFARVRVADQGKPADLEFESHGVKVIVDPKSLVFIDGTELDFAREGERWLQVQNPKVDECAGELPITTSPIARRSRRSPHGVRAVWRKGPKLNANNASGWLPCVRSRPHRSSRAFPSRNRAAASRPLRHAPSRAERLCSEVTRVNDAYQTLENPGPRAKYLLVRVALAALTSRSRRTPRLMEILERKRGSPRRAA